MHLPVTRVLDWARNVLRRLVVLAARAADAALSYIDQAPPWFHPDRVQLEQESDDLHPVPASRHDIAESGLRCPLCGSLVAPAGDYSGVRRCWVDGHLHEVVKCQGKKTYADRGEMQCKALLVAHPDTEHGDHLADRRQEEIDGVRVDIGGLHPEWRVFRRRSAAAIVRERLGDDIVKEPSP